MPKTKISEFSAVPGNNTDIDGINIAEGCAPSGINDAIRELMSQLKDFQAGTAGDSFNGPIGATTPAAGTFTNLSASGTFALTGDQVQISEGGTGQTTANAAFNALAPSQSTHAGKYLKTDGTNTSWDALDISTADITGTLPVANGGTGVTSSTGTGSVVLSASPTFTGTVNGVALTLSSSLTLSGGTANGVAYLNGSKVLTTGSALTFDGTNLLNSGALRLTGGALSNVRFEAGGTEYARIMGNGSNSLDFAVGGTTPSMSLTSTGLGIGTSSPSQKLHINVASGTVYEQISSGSNNVYLGFDNSRTVGTLQSNNALVFDVGGIYTERMRIDTSGNLGLGVTPSAWVSTAFQTVNQAALMGYANSTFLGQNWLYASGPTSKYLVNGYALVYEQNKVTGAHAWYNSVSGLAGNAITFTQAMTLDAGGNFMVGYTSSSAIANKNIDVNGTGDSAFVLRVGGTTTAYLYSIASQAILGTVGALPITFNPNGTERARITSDGYFKASNNGTYLGGSSHELRNTSNGSYSTRIIHAGATDAYGLNVYFSGYSPNGTANWFLLCEDTTATRAEIRSNGGLANYSANNVNLSDRREKTNFAPAKSYLDTICAIPVQTFNYIDQSEDDPGLTLGVVAQDVQAVAPELVMESNWGTAEDPKMRLSIYQTDLQYALMKCIQELKAQNDELRARVAQLEAK